MRRNRDDFRNENDPYRNQEPQWLHEQRHGHSDRGHYTLDSHFNMGYGEGADNNYGDQRSFNMNADQGYMSPQGRFQPGGAPYSGEDFTRNRNISRDNPYGMSYTRHDGYNSGRHYDARADYSNHDYDNLRHNRSHAPYSGMADERFGHEIHRGDRNEPYMGHSSIGDYESYRRYEMGNRAYDNDYSGGFAGRNHTEGRSHFGEDSYYSNLDMWNDQNRSRFGRNTNKRKTR
ncbi:hypothetical protein [Botryobacter ruber]|uniref:hypothetical protein n=1 Tax=Botryobacter ruber TaxID=2171629 RepID=UPI000E0B897A|nr:hypothetical protein [Botryobacter ruber]